MNRREPPPQANEPLITLTYPKPNLFTLMLRHRLQLLDLAKASCQHPLVLWGMLTDHPVKPEHAVQVLATINDTCHTTYQLSNLALNLEEEHGTR